MGPAARRDRRCNARHTTSLPVPVSPTTSTGSSRGATLSSSANISRMGSLIPSSPAAATAPPAAPVPII